MKTHLSDLPSGKEATIVSIQGGVGMQRRLGRLGLHEGQRIRKTSNIAGRGPVIITVNRTQIAIGRGMAQKIEVETV